MFSCKIRITVFFWGLLAEIIAKLRRVSEHQGQDDTYTYSLHSNERGFHALLHTCSTVYYKQKHLQYCPSHKNHRLLLLFFCKIHIEEPWRGGTAYSLTIKSKRDLTVTCFCSIILQDIQSNPLHIPNQFVFLSPASSTTKHNTPSSHGY